MFFSNDVPFPFQNFKLYCIIVLFWHGNLRQLQLFSLSFSFYVINGCLRLFSFFFFLRILAITVVCCGYVKNTLVHMGYESLLYLFIFFVLFNLTTVVFFCRILAVIFLFHSIYSWLFKTTLISIGFQPLLCILFTCCVHYIVNHTLTLYGLCPLFFLFIILYFTRGIQYKLIFALYFNYSYLLIVWFTTNSKPLYFAWLLSYYYVYLVCDYFSIIYIYMRE